MRPKKNVRMVNGKQLTVKQFNIFETVKETIFKVVNTDSSLKYEDAQFDSKSLGCLADFVANYLNMHSLNTRRKTGIFDKEKIRQIQNMREFLVRQDELKKQRKINLVRKNKLVERGGSKMRRQPSMVLDPHEYRISKPRKLSIIQKSRTAEKKKKKESVGSRASLTKRRKKTRSIDGSLGKSVFQGEFKLSTAFKLQLSRFKRTSMESGFRKSSRASAPRSRPPARSLWTTRCPWKTGIPWTPATIAACPSPSAWAKLRFWAGSTRSWA